MSDKPHVQHWLVDVEHAGQRLDNYLLSRLKGVPRSLVYRIIRSGEVRVNRGRVEALYRVQEGDELRIPPVRTSEVFTETLPAGANLLHLLESRIVLEKNGLLVLNKPQGLAVHGGSGIAHGVIETVRQMRPKYSFLELAHRIDRDTSGLLVLAYKRSALLDVQAALQHADTLKSYQSVLAGLMPDAAAHIQCALHKYTLPSGEMRVKVDKSGKAASSEFLRSWCGSLLTGVEVRIHTGRTHQIRVHALSMGLPVLGDDKYGDALVNDLWRKKGFGRLYLHAARLDLALASGSLSLEVPLEGNMADLWQRGQTGLL